jgi:hypothetical protein
MADLVTDVAAATGPPTAFAPSRSPALWADGGVGPFEIGATAVEWIVLTVVAVASVATAAGGAASFGSGKLETLPASFAGALPAEAPVAVPTSLWGVSATVVPADFVWTIGGAWEPPPDGLRTASIAPDTGDDAPGSGVFAFTFGWPASGGLGVFGALDAAEDAGPETSATAFPAEPTEPSLAAPPTTGSAAPKAGAGVAPAMQSARRRTAGNANRRCLGAD